MADAVKRITFADFTAPLDPQRFFDQYWTREAVHLRREGRRFDDYFGWAQYLTVTKFDGRTYFDEGNGGPTPDP